MKTLLLSGACVLALSGCASFSNSPATVNADVTAAVQDTKTVTTGAVSIAGDLLATVLSLISPITEIGTAIGNL